MKEDDKDLIWEATVEHGTLEGLIAVIQDAESNDVMYDAHLTVLKEYVEHHVKEEEKEMFPKVRKTGIDLDGMGQEIQTRKDELIAGAAPQRGTRAKRTG